MEFAFCSKNGKVVPASEATVSVFNIEYSYGFGVYESLRVKKGTPLFLNEHTERLLCSAKAINLLHRYTSTTIEKYCMELLESLSGVESCNLKILLIGASDPLDAQLFILPLSPYYPDKKLYTQGAKVITVRYERVIPNAKTLNMLPSYLHYKKAKESGCYDVLFVNEENYILEGSRTNFFAIKGKTIYTAPESIVLPGVARKHVIEVAMSNGYEVKEGLIALSNLGKFDGAFFTSTSSKIMPLAQVDEHKFEITKEEVDLIKVYDQFLDNQLAVYDARL